MFLGERLKQLRKRKYSQEELADLLDVHYNTVSQWENGGQEPRIKHVKELAKLLGTSSAYLMGETDNPTAPSNPLPDILPPVASLNRNGNTAEQHQQITYWSDFLGNIQEISKRGNLDEIKVAENFLNSALILLKVGKTQVSNSTVSAYNGNNSVYAGNNLNTGTMA